VLLSRLVQSQPCEACHTPATVTAEDWAAILGYAAQGFLDDFNLDCYNVHARTRPSALPACAECAAPMPLDQLAVGTSATIACTCGAALATYPAPSWLKAGLPAIDQVFETHETSGASSSSQRAQAVVMSCPSCGGGLDITTDSQRTTKCTFCSANVYLPDDLWRSLHPVKTARAWSIAYTGDLMRSDW
jgi:hypothetical protein